MRRDEVHGCAALLNVGEEFRHPGRSCGRRTSDAQNRVNGLNGPCSQVIKVEIRLLIGSFPEAREVGLVPDFEVPAAYLLATVALLNMTDESSHQAVPAHGVRVRGVTVPIEDTVLGRGERLGGETELHERLEVLRQQLAIELVDLRPVVTGFSVVDSHRSQDIVEDGVKSYISESKFIYREFELCLTIVTNQCSGKIGADRQIKVAIHRASRVADIRNDHTV